MLGNVSEWTSSKFSMYKGHPFPDKDDKAFIVRGLNFRSSTETKLFEKPKLMLTVRSTVPESFDDSFLGFRLVCEP